jgi:hypothetical protein
MYPSRRGVKKRLAAPTVIAVRSVAGIAVNPRFNHPTWKGDPMSRLSLLVVAVLIAATTCLAQDPAKARLENCSAPLP